jgi:hypothetical protein
MTDGGGIAALWNAGDRPAIEPGSTVQGFSRHKAFQALAFRLERLRSGLVWHISLSANRYPPPIKPGAGVRRDMR